MSRSSVYFCGFFRAPNANPQQVRKQLDASHQNEACEDKANGEEKPALLFNHPFQNDVASVQEEAAGGMSPPL